MSSHMSLVHAYLATIALFLQRSNAGLSGSQWAFIYLYKETENSLIILRPTDGVQAQSVLKCLDISCPRMDTTHKGLKLMNEFMKMKTKLPESFQI